MGIKMTTPIYRVHEYLERIAQIVHEEIMQTLSKLGVECVSRIKDRSAKESWIDHTGNLRSSIGSAVYEEGRKKIEGEFGQVLNGSHGVSEGRKMVDELAGKYSTTYALVVVAAMNYAEYVEAMENKDVLASTELWARSVLDKHLDQARSRALTRIKGLKF